MKAIITVSTNECVLPTFCTFGGFSAKLNDGKEVGFDWYCQDVSDIENGIFTVEMYEFESDFFEELNGGLDMDVLKNIEFIIEISREFSYIPDQIDLNHEILAMELVFDDGEVRNLLLKNLDE